MGHSQLDYQEGIAKRAHQEKSPRRIRRAAVPVAKE